MRWWCVDHIFRAETLVDIELVDFNSIFSAMSLITDLDSAPINILYGHGVESASG